MKYFSLISILTCLMGVTSCSQSKSPTTLKISSSFALTNSSFDGGLIIYGTNGSQSFSQAVLQNSGSGSNSLQIILPNGNWTFYATGWKNSSGNNLSGDIFCDAVTETLTGSDATVALNVTQGGCDSDSFGSTNPAAAITRDVAQSNKIKMFNLLTCGSFYDAGVLINKDTVNNYCNQTTMPVDMRNWAKSFKIIAANKTLNDEFSGAFATECIVPNMDSLSNTTRRLPSKNIPFIFELYEDSGCNKTLTTYPMHNGIDFPYPQMDKMILNGSGSYTLVLPSNETKKGTSPFYNILPEFSCVGQQCVPGSSYKHYVKAGGTVTLAIDKDSNPNIDGTDYNVTPTGDWSFNSCTKQDDIIMCSFTIMSTCGGLCDSTIGGLFRYSYVKSGIPQGIFTAYISPDDTKIDSLGIAFKLLGRANHPSQVDDFQSSDEYLPHYGAFKKVREMLGPDKIGGLISRPGVTCANVTIANHVFDMEDNGEQKRFRLTVGTPTANVLASTTNSFFCQRNSYSACTLPDSNYEKKILLEELQTNGSYQPMTTIAFSCDPTNRRGRIQQKHTEYHPDETTLESKENSILIWNIPDPSHATLRNFARFEAYYQEYEYDISGSPEGYRASFDRVAKVGLLDTDLEINGMTYSRKNYGGPVYDEEGQRYFMQQKVGKFSSEVYDVEKNGITNSLFSDPFISTGVYSVAGSDIRVSSGKLTTATTFDLTINPSTLIGAAPQAPYISQGPAGVTTLGQNIKLIQLSPGTGAFNFDDTFIIDNFNQ